MTDVLNVSLYSPQGLVVDWIGRTMYWADSRTQRIEVARLDGSNRKVLFYEDITNITSVAIDFESR